MGGGWERLSGTHLSPQVQVQWEVVCVLLSGGAFWREDQDQWISCVSQRHECGGSFLWEVGQKWVFNDLKHNSASTLQIHVMSTIIPGLFWRLMSQHQTTMEGNYCLHMMATCTFSQVTVEWQETHLENMGIPRTSKKATKVLTWEMLNVVHVQLNLSDLIYMATSTVF